MTIPLSFVTFDFLSERKSHFDEAKRPGGERLEAQAQTENPTGAPEDDCIVYRMESLDCTRDSNQCFFSRKAFRHFVSKAFDRRKFICCAMFNVDSKL